MKKILKIRTYDIDIDEILDGNSIDRVLFLLTRYANDAKSRYTDCDVSFETEKYNGAIEQVYMNLCRPETDEEEKARSFLELSKVNVELELEMKEYQRIKEKYNL